MSIDELLKIIQKTNPTMTKELLIYELGQCRYSSKALIYTEKLYSLFSPVLTFMLPSCFA